MFGQPSRRPMFSSALSQVDNAHKNHLMEENKLKQETITKQYQLGFYLLSTEQYSVAREAFEKLMNLDDTGTAEFKMGVCFFEEKNFGEAKKYFMLAADKALAKNNDDKQGIYFAAKSKLCDFYLHENNIPCAIAAYICAYFFEPYNTDIILEKISKQLADIFEELPKGKFNLPNPILLFTHCVNKGLLSTLQGSKEIGEIAALTSMYSHRPENFSDIADGYFFTKNYKEAINMYNKFIQFAKKKGNEHLAEMPSVYFKLAKTHYALNNDKETALAYGIVMLSFSDCSSNLKESDKIDALANDYKNMLGQVGFLNFFLGISHLEPEEKVRLYRECLGLNPQTNSLSSVLNDCLNEQKFDVGTYLSESIIALINHYSENKLPGEEILLYVQLLERFPDSKDLNNNLNMLLKKHDDDIIIAAITEIENKDEKVRLLFECKNPASIIHKHFMRERGTWSSMWAAITSSPMEQIDAICRETIGYVPTSVISTCEDNGFKSPVDNQNRL